MRKAIIISVFVLVLVGLFACHGLRGANEYKLAAVESVIVRAETLPLDQGAPAMIGADTVQFRGGWVLSSPTPAFGGFSGLVLEPDAHELLAINDRGGWWRSAFDPTNGEPPSGISMMAYSPDTEFKKEELDSESLIHFDGGYLVSFEQNHRLEWMTAPAEAPVVSPLSSEIDYTGLSNNGGMEAIVELADGRLLAFTERGLAGDGTLKAWLVNKGGAETLSFYPPKNFSPTDAARLPDGSILVLLRRYSVVDGNAIKVLHIQASSIQAGNRLVGTEILSLSPKFTVDNMEGLDVAVLDENTVRLVMISDDNFNPLQRTLLLMFDYQYSQD
jgi:hypothetical protein